MNKYEVIENIRMATIPAGSFMMGHDYKHDPSLPDIINKYYPDEQPVHRVTLRAFQLGATPVTQGQYMKVMGENPSTFKGDDNLPVTNMGAGMVERFCKVRLPGLNRVMMKKPENVISQRTVSECRPKRNGNMPAVPGQQPFSIPAIPNVILIEQDGT